jgi:hypothetical protein
MARLAALTDLVKATASQSPDPDIASDAAPTEANTAGLVAQLQGLASRLSALEFSGTIITAR